MEEILASIFPGKLWPDELDFDGIELKETTQAGFDFSKPYDLMDKNKHLLVTGQFDAITIGAALWKIRLINVN